MAGTKDNRVDENEVQVSSRGHRIVRVNLRPAPSDIEAALRFLVESVVKEILEQRQG
jgi:hypothetical protein